MAGHGHGRHGALQLSAGDLVWIPEADALRVRQLEASVQILGLFLGQGIPPTTPSLGTLIRVGNEYLFSGLWWITFFPAIALVVLVFAVNLLGDWMRDALNPKLR